MSQYQESAGRSLEIIVGIGVSFITLILIALMSILITNASIQLASLVGGLLLALAIYWFGQISVRLLFNLPRKNGGLFSIGGLKFWCIFLSVSSVFTIILGAYMGYFGAVLGGIGLIVGCYYGWQLACKRNN